MKRFVGRQCDQMLDLKMAQYSQKAAQNVDKAVSTQKVTFFKIAQKVAKYLGFFRKKLCHQELTNIAQSGHTV